MGRAGSGDDSCRRTFIPNEVDDCTQCFPVHVISRFDMEASGYLSRPEAKRLKLACAKAKWRFSAGTSLTRPSLWPEATGAVMGGSEMAGTFRLTRQFEADSALNRGISATSRLAFCFFA